MNSLGQIMTASREQGIQAANSNQVPLVIERQDADNRAVLTDMIRRIPNLGDHVPEGWVEVNRYMVDSSGLEDAFEVHAHGGFTHEELLDKIVPGRGYAIVEEGQFQVKIGEFTKIVDERR